MILDFMKYDNREVYLDDEHYKICDIGQSRFFTHNEHGMAIISACHEGIPINKRYEDFTPAEKARYEENKKNTELLRQDIRNAGLGYTTALGGYPNEDDKGLDVHEFSFIVPRNPAVMDEEEFVDFVTDMILKYDQKSALVSGISFIDNGQPRYITRNYQIKTREGIDPEYDFTGLSTTKEFDPEKRPYYTRSTKGPKATFVYTMDSKQKVLAVHHPHGMAGNHIAAKKGEFIIYLND